MFECQGSSPKPILIRVPSRRTRSISHVCYDLVMCSLACQLLPLCMEMCSDAKMCFDGCPRKTWVDHWSWWSSLCSPNAVCICLQLHYPITHVYYDLVTLCRDDILCRLDGFLVAGVRMLYWSCPMYIIYTASSTNALSSPHMLHYLMSWS